MSPTSTTEPRGSVAAGAHLADRASEEQLERLLDGLVHLGGSMAARSRTWGGVAGGLTRGDMAALGALAQSGPTRSGVLAAELQVGAPVMSRHLAALEAQGLVTRDPDPADGRAELVSVSAAGRERLRRAKRAVCRRLAERFEGWDVQRLARTADGVEDLVAALDERPAH